MCKQEIMNKEDRKEQKKMAVQAVTIHKSLVGQLSYSTEEWLRVHKQI